MNNVLVIGMGSIGGLKDDKYDSLDSDNVLTHTHAISVHPEFKLYGVMDTDKDKVIKAVEKWKCMGFTDLEQVNENEVDIVVIATPTWTHFDVYNQIKSWGLKAIILEKPAGDSLAECEKMEYDKRIVVNYTRRFLPEYKKLKEKLDNMKVLSCVVNYVRGVKRDACHAINLVNYFLGDIHDVKFISKGSDDYSKDDTSDCFWMRTEKCPNVVFVPGDGRVVDHFDIEILTKEGMYCLYNHGSTIYERKVEKEKLYGDYMSLQGNVYCGVHIDFKSKLLMNLYDKVNDFIQSGKNPCPLKEAIEVHRVIERIRSKE